MRPAPAAPRRRPTTPTAKAEIGEDITGELSAVRSLYAAIEGGIMTTAPPSTLYGLLATLRAQQRATETEITERGKRRREWLQAFVRAARSVAAKLMPQPRPLARRVAYPRPRGVP